jgi:hypothetical protein
MSYPDISEKTQLQTETIYKNIHEALKRLRVIFWKIATNRRETYPPNLFGGCANLCAAK